MYDTLKEELPKKGEIMIQFDSGKEAELHLHNTTFLDKPMIKVEADDETHWFNAQKIERYWIHEDF